MIVNLSWVIIVLSALLVIFTGVNGVSPTPALAPLAISIFNIVGSKKPVLVFFDEHLEFKASGFGASLLIRYDSVKSVEDMGKNIRVEIKDKKRPYKFHISHFIKDDIEDVKNTFKAIVS